MATRIGDRIKQANFKLRKRHLYTGIFLLFLFILEETVLNTTKINRKCSFPDPGSFYPVYLRNFKRIVLNAIQVCFKLKLNAVSVISTFRRVNKILFACVITASRKGIVP
jgi:hypothetical protein